MTVVADILARLEAQGCHVKVEGDKVILVESGPPPAPNLKAEARKAKPAIRYALLRKQAEELAAFVDGDSPLPERQAQLSELLALQDRLAAAQEELWESWRRDGFTILWSALVEEFILVGDSSKPPGSEAIVLYTREEVEALKDACPERVIQAHRVKKAFGGTIATGGYRQDAENDPRTLGKRKLEKDGGH